MSRFHLAMSFLLPASRKRFAEGVSYIAKVKTSLSVLFDNRCRQKFKLQYCDYVNKQKKTAAGPIKQHNKEINKVIKTDQHNKE